MSLKKGIISKEHAKKSLATLKDVEDTLLNGKELTFEQEKSLSCVMIESKQQANSLIEHAAALDIGARFDKIIEGEDGRGGVLAHSIQK